MVKENNYNEQIGAMLRKHSLKICSCEYGTNGLIGSLLTKIKNSKSLYIGGMILNDNLFSNNFVEYIKNFKNKLNSDVIIGSFVEEKKCICYIYIIDKLYTKTFELKTNDDSGIQSSIISLSYLYDTLKESDK
ncbi:MAG: hypothetical protein LBS95_02735 [Mycoplasmataceae bacterium]|jgi:hypothetical protein|nr:hypothetical protein [Mycoplasmataceae bacterium]